MTVLIIGAGPGGYETALEAARRGAEVTLIHEGPLGGVCLNEGCIPTKTFCAMAAPGVSLEQIQLRKSEVVSGFRSGVELLLTKAGVRLVNGHARFRDRKTVMCGDVEYTADYIIVATGSRSASLPIPGAELAGVLDSAAMLDMETLPGRICVIGGGVIGLEFASVFSRLGSSVTVLEYCKELLPRFDTDLSRRLRQQLARSGIVVETAARVKAIEPGMKVIYEKKEAEAAVECDVVLMTVGRRPDVDNLGLDAAGIDYSPKGIVVDGNMRTSADGIFAIGDVTGGMMLAHAATFQGRKAISAIFGTSDSVRLDICPAAVFTEPELACVGKSEDDCRAEGIDIEVRKSFFRSNGKAVAMGCTEGICKIILEKDSGRILGCHIMGPHASDLIQEVTVAMNFDASAAALRDVIHAHPTLSEVVLNALSE